MTHEVDGFDLRYTSRTSWKVERRVRGRVVDVIPVAWFDSRRKDHATGKLLQDVWYRDPAEAAKVGSTNEPFFIAGAHAKDPKALPRKFDRFYGVFEVRATGTVTAPNCVEVEVINRMTAVEGER